MKKMLLAVGALLVGLTGMAQTYTTQRGDTAMDAYTTGTGLKIINRVKSTSGAVKLKWRVKESSIPTGWSLVGVCDNITCYNQAQSSILTSSTWRETDSVDNDYANSATFGLGDENNFDVEYDNMTAAPNNSRAIIRVEMYDGAAAASTSKVYTYIATKGTAGISTYRSDDVVVLYPNPANDAINVLFDANAGVKNIAIYNLIGQPVSVFHVAGNSANLPLGDAPAGVYFVRLLDGQGHILATRRFTKQ